jgi:uncharacterized protein
VRKDITFLSDNIKLFGVLVVPQRAQRGVIFFHGGGHASTKRYSFLQTYFEKVGIASLSFDFRGCGQSQGSFEDGSLVNRLIDAENALLFFQNQTGLAIDNIFVWGSSMGGHIACRLTEKYPKLAGVILQSAAAYGVSAENVLLNDEFSNMIRQEKSWENSPAFQALEKFAGKKLVVFGERDVVIPEEVKIEYKRLSQHNGKYICIEGGSHTLLHPQNEVQQLALEKLSEIAAQFIKE